MNGGPSSGVATLAGGCFWCIEAIFLEVEGVSAVIPGYTGGTTANPTYDEVCTGQTGHAEALQVTFRPGQAFLPGNPGGFLLRTRPNHLEPARSR